VAPVRWARTFGEEIRRRRRAAGLTIEQLAERSELSVAYISSVENGRRDPSLSTLLALAKGLRAPLADIVGGKAWRGELTSAQSEAAHLFGKVPLAVRDAILAILRDSARRRR
jgi:transcriptional regulator with XRE-family HTH domain